jgi:ribonuclease J
MPALNRVISSTRRRVIVASFSSHVHRVQQEIDIAAQHGRKVVFIGRSMVRNMKIAEDMGYLNVPADLVMDAKDLDQYDDNFVLICTGSQGEPMAALSRMANGDHQIRVGEGDTVILASSLIPGNENSVFRVINELTRFGAKVVHKANAMVHVSGHAAAGELLYCYNIVKPKYVMPIHGEWRHMKANAELAIQSGVPRGNTFIVDNGVVIDLVNHEAEVVGAIASEVVRCRQHVVARQNLSHQARVLGQYAAVNDRHHHRALPCANTFCVHCGRRNRRTRLTA